MKWFLAINEDSDAFSEYAEMLQVAIVSGQRYNALEPYVLYDGSPNWLTKWLRERGVDVWAVRTRFYRQLQSIAERTSQPRVTQFGAGTMLRLELPDLALARGLRDRYVLYTDLDVLFLADPTEDLGALQPRYLAIAPELEPDQLGGINAGVMVMNLPALRRDQRRFFRHLTKNLPRYMLNNRAADQDAYLEWYGPHRQRLSHKLSWRLEKLIGVHLARPVLWDPLPATLNWKTHWGPNPDAQIIHFHGVKPRQRRIFDSPDFLARNPHFSYVFERTDMAYFDALCEKWEEQLQLAKAAPMEGPVA